VSVSEDGPRPLPVSFFARPAEDVARDLVGAVVVRTDPGSAVVMARLVEVEAYADDDPACHAYRGRTRANATLFGPPGHLYVYRSYGIHWCVNVVADGEGTGAGCLLRAARVEAGEDVVRERRGAHHRRENLLRGPGNLGRGLAIDGSWDGVRVGSPSSAAAIAASEADPALWVGSDGGCPDVVAGPRVGVSRGADTPWRFRVPGQPTVSAYRRSDRA